MELLYYSNINPSAQINASNALLHYHYIQSGVRNGWGLDIKDNGRLCFGMARRDGSDWVAAFSVTSLKASTWYHIVATYDSANMKMYVNGLLESTSPYAGTYPAPSIDAYLGCQKRMDYGI
jgi:hypothetical protein